MDGQSLMNSKISNRGFQGWTAETSLNGWDREIQRYCDWTVRNSTIKIGIFSLDPNIASPFFGIGPLYNCD